MAVNFVSIFHPGDYFNYSKTLLLFRKKFEVKIINNPRNVNQNRELTEASRRLAMLGTEYKYDIYSVLQSGRYGTELASLSFAKVGDC